MRHVYTATAALLALTMFGPPKGLAQSGTAGLTIGNYQFVSEQRSTRTAWFVTYRAELLNNGPARPAMAATVTSLVPTVKAVPGQGTLQFPPVAANARIVSSNTFTIEVDRSVTFDFGSLSWSFLNPIANAGPNQTASVGSTVTLSGAGSSNPSGSGTLTYAWAFVSRPTGSNAVLNNPNTVSPTFVVDLSGNYVIALSVSNGSGSDTAQVTVSTVNTLPVANAGPDQTVPANSTVILNGSGSSDVDGDPLTYQWTLISQPTGSTAVLSNATSVSPTFVANKGGVYVAQLIVNDGKVGSSPDTVTITTSNTQPVAVAGPAQTVTVGALVQLNGSASTDVDGDPLTYKWSLITVPSGSTAVLSSTTAVNPTFTANVAGTYVAQLIVNDGKIDSAPSTVTITTNAPPLPVANAGSNQTVVHGATVTLIGSGTDSQGLPLTFTWSLITRPVNSTAVLSSTTAQSPTFVADRLGIYVAQLIVGNGTQNSLPSTVTITTTNTQPVANAGPDQSVLAGATVSLNGGGSSDADNDPLTYSWTFTSRPNGSTATLSAATSPTPTFVADIGGTYVVQLIVNDGYVDSLFPDTVTITAGATRITLSPSPLNLTTVASGTLTVGLTVPAGPTDFVVSLSGFDPNVISLNPSVTIPANSTGANITVTPLAAGNTSILATAPGFQPASVAVTVTTPSISLTLGSAVGIGRSVTGTIQLSSPAPASGTVIALDATPTGLVTLDPASVTIPAGQSTGSFTVTGAAAGTAAISATSGGYNGTSASILVASLGAISIAPNVTVAAGQTAPLAITLSGPAPSGGVTVTLASGDPSKVTIPPSVFIPQGSATPDTPVLVTGVALGTSLITASATGYTGASQTVTVAATLTFAPTSLSVGVGGTQNLTLALTGTPPAGGLIVNLTSSSPSVATVPPSVTITGPATSVTIPVIGNSTGSTTITASTTTPNVTGTTALVTVTVFGGIVLPTNPSVGLGQSVSFPITLSTPAPDGGVTVTLSSSDPTKVSISPGTVTIPAQQTQPATQPQITGVAPGSATITATASGFGSTTETVQTTASLSLAPQPLTITGTDTRTLTVTLSGPAPAGGITVNLASSALGIVSIPATVSIAENTTSASVQVAGLALGTTTVTASSATPNVTSGTTTVTVQGAGTIIVPSGVTVSLGQSVPFQITLPAPAPTGGVTVTLTSDNPSIASISPGTVTIAAGATQPATAPQVTGSSLGTAAITASAPTYTSATQAVQVTATISLTPPTLTLNAGETQNLTLTLSGPAPTAGLAVNVSSSNTGAVTVSSGSFTIPAGSTSVTIPVTGVALGSSVIRATATGVADATSNVTVEARNVSLAPSALTISSPGQQGTLTLTRFNDSSAAVSFTLTSSNPGVATVPNSVFLTPGTSVISFQVTGVGAGTTVITARADGFADITSTVTVEPPGTLTLSAATTPVQVGAPFPLTVTLSKPSPASGTTINLTSDNPKVRVSPAALFIPEGSTTGTATITGSNVGNATISATAQGYTLVSPIVVQIGATIVWVTPSATISGIGQQAFLELRLNSTVPGGPDFNPNDGIAISLTSSNPNVATVNSTVFFFWDGSNAPSILIPVTSVGPGTTTITASGTNIPAVTATVNVAGPLSITTTSLPNGVAGTPYSVTVTAAGGTLPLTFSAVGLPSSLSINSSNGLISGTPAAAFTGNVSITVNDSMSPTPLTTTANFSLTITPGGPPPPASIIVASGSPQEALPNFPFASEFKALVRDASNQPLSGVTVMFTAPSSGPSGTFPSGLVATALTDSSGVATAPIFTANAIAGNYGVVASVGALSATFQLTNLSGGGGGGTISAPNLTIGKDLQAPLLITLNPPVGAGGTTITISSGDPSRVLIGGAGFLGSGSTSVPLSQGTSTISTFIQALAGSGSTTVTISAPGYEPVVSTITLAPSGFVISGPNGIGGAFTAFQNVNIPLTVLSGRLDGSSLFAERQAVRGGFSVNVSLNNSVPAVGNLSASSVTVPGGGDSAGVTFTGTNTGGTNVSVSTPVGFNTPATGTSLSITVQQSGILPFTATVAQGLQKAVFVTLNAPAASGLQLTIQSNDPTTLKFSNMPDGAGENQIVVAIPAGQTASPDFYAQAFGNSGSAPYTITGTGLGMVTGSVTLAPAGLIIQSPAGPGANFNAPSGITAELTVITGRVSGGVVVERQAVAGAGSVSVTVASSNPSVATVASPISIAGGTDSAATQFQPIGEGQAIVTASATGFTQGQVTGTVVVSSLIVDSEIEIGQNLQQPANILLPQPAGAGGVPVTITANSPMIRLATTPTGAGSSSIVVTVPAGQPSAIFYVHALGDTGTFTYTATHASFRPATGNVILRKSGIILFPTTTSASLAGSVIVTAFSAVLDDTNAFAGTQPVAGPSALTIPVQSSNPAVATVPATVSFPAGAETMNVPVTLRAVGSTTITVTQPAGFTQPTSFNSTTITVNP